MRSSTVALLGLLGMLPLTLGLLQGSLTLEAAATRALVLLAALVAVERLVLPFVRAALAPPAPRRRADDVVE